MVGATDWKVLFRRTMQEKELDTENTDCQGRMGVKETGDARLPSHSLFFQLQAFDRISTTTVGSIWYRMKSQSFPILVTRLT